MHEMYLTHTHTHTYTVCLHGPLSTQMHILYTCRLAAADAAVITLISVIGQEGWTHNNILTPTKTQRRWKLYTNLQHTSTCIPVLLMFKPRFILSKNKGPFLSSVSLWLLLFPLLLFWFQKICQDKRKGANVGRPTWGFYLSRLMKGNWKEMWSLSASLSKSSKRPQSD